MAGDAPCAAGEFKYWANTSTNKIRKCENGTISDMDSAPASYGTNMGPKGDEYDPDRAPSTSKTDSACTDEFDGGATATWTWVNQGSSTWTTASDVDYAHLSLPADNASTRGLYCVPNNGADWTWTVKLTVHAHGQGSGNSVSGGLWAIDGGTIGSPTTTVLLGVLITSANANVLWSSRTGYTGTVNAVNGTNIENITSLAGVLGRSAAREICLQMRYVVSTKVMTVSYAADCRNWFFNVTPLTRTFSAHPPAIGIYGDTFSPTTASMEVEVQWARFRTDADGTSGEYLVGQ
jgi:hypothetical protein